MFPTFIAVFFLVGLCYSNLFSTPLESLNSRSSGFRFWTEISFVAHASFRFDNLLLILCIHASRKSDQLRVDEHFASIRILVFFERVKETQVLLVPNIKRAKETQVLHVCTTKRAKSRECCAMCNEMRNWRQNMMQQKGTIFLAGFLFLDLYIDSSLFPAK